MFIRLLYNYKILKKKNELLKQNSFNFFYFNFFYFNFFYFNFFYFNFFYFWKINISKVNLLLINKFFCFIILPDFFKSFRLLLFKLEKYKGFRKLKKFNRFLKNKNFTTFFNNVTSKTKLGYFRKKNKVKSIYIQNFFKKTRAPRPIFKKKLFFLIKKTQAKNSIEKILLFSKKWASILYLTRKKNVLHWYHNKKFLKKKIQKHKFYIRKKRIPLKYKSQLQHSSFPAVWTNKNLTKTNPVLFYLWQLNNIFFKTKYKSYVTDTQVITFFHVNYFSTYPFNFKQKNSLFVFIVFVSFNFLFEFFSFFFKFKKYTYSLKHKKLLYLNNLVLENKFFKIRNFSNFKLYLIQEKNTLLTKNITKLYNIINKNLIFKNKSKPVFDKTFVLNKNLFLFFKKIKQNLILNFFSQNVFQLTNISWFVFFCFLPNFFFKNIKFFKTSKKLHSPLFKSNLVLPFFLNKKNFKSILLKSKKQKIKNYFLFFNIFISNFLEDFFKTKIFFKLKKLRKIKKKLRKKDFFKKLIFKFKHYYFLIGRGFFLKEMLDVLWITFLLKDSEFLVKWLCKTFERIDLKKHRKFLLLLKFLLKNLFLRFKYKLKCKGFFFDIRGKVGVSGNAKKRHVTIIRGKNSFSEKKCKLSCAQSIVRTHTGVLGLNFILLFM